MDSFITAEMAKTAKKKIKKKDIKAAVPLTLNIPVKPLLPDIQIPSPKTQAILFAVATDSLDSVTRMVSSYNFRDTLATKDMNGSTPLHIAVRKENSAMVEKILSYPNVPINALEEPNSGGYSALHIACRFNLFKIVGTLLESKADPNIKTSSTMKESPLHVCCKFGALESARLLLSAGASSDARDCFGHNPSFWASSKQNTQMIKDLSLPPIHRATAEEHFALILQKNPLFTLTVAPKKKKSVKKKGK